MTTITIATRTKPNPNSKVGIAFARNTDGRIMITRVFDSGLFNGSGLLPGQELLSINGADMHGKSLDEVLATLKSIETEITINAGPGKQSAMLCCSLEKHETQTRLHFGSQQASRVPPFLASKGVSTHKWSRLVEAFQTQLLPAIQQSLTMDQVLGNEMRAYTGKQMGKGFVGFGQESHHERKVFLMTHQAAIQHSNLTMVANNVVTKANALLNGHGVMAEFDFTVKGLQNYSTNQRGKNSISYPTLILFTPIDNDGSAPSARASATSATPIANATVVPVNDDSDC